MADGGDTPGTATPLVLPVVDLVDRVDGTDPVDYYQFTTLINSNYTLEQKVSLVDRLWRIAYANETLHKYEEHLVRKIADLLYVPHSAFIAAKLSARGES